MKEKSAILTISAFSVMMIIVVVLILQGQNQDAIERELVTSLSIYPGGSANPRYVFSINVDQTLQVQFRRINIFGGRIDENKEILLTKEEFQLIMELLEKVSLDGHSDEGRLRSLGGWEVRLLYNGTVYEANYSHNHSDAFQELVAEIVELSPIEVDIHSLS